MQPCEAKPLSYDEQLAIEVSRAFQYYEFVHARQQAARRDPTFDLMHAIESAKKDYFDRYAESKDRRPILSKYLYDLALESGFYTAEHLEKNFIRVSY